MAHVCEACDSRKTYVKRDGCEQWHNHDGSWLCEKCFKKYVASPIYNPIINAKWNPFKINFKQKMITLKKKPRSGVCKICGLRGKRTHIHHISYHENDPLKDTIELCVSCHKLIDNIHIC